MATTTLLDLEAQHLRADHVVSVTTFVADLATDAGVDALIAHTETLPCAVGLLVNNAGFGD